jgi:hypothetical protein
MRQVKQRRQRFKALDYLQNDCSAKPIFMPSKIHSNSGDFAFIPTRGSSVLLLSTTKTFAGL